MNTTLKKTLISLGALLALVTLITTTAYAIGTLTPSGTPGSDTQYTLNDIYAKLTDFTATADEGTGLFDTPGTVSATFNTLTEIYALLEAEEADLVAENIRDGVTIFGVEGAHTGPTLEYSTAQGADTDWNTAVAYCAALTEGGATAGDWRLPTIGELADGFYSDLNVPAVFGEGTNYWSSSEKDADNAFNGFVFFGDIFIGNNGTAKTGGNDAVCVREV